MVDLGTLGGTYSQAAAVDDHGQAVGYSTTAGGVTHAFWWTARGGMVDLGTLGGDYSNAVAINDDGQVVGYSTTAGSHSDTAGNETHAFSWTKKGGMVDLGTLGGNSSSAAAVNNRGQVVGVARQRRPGPSSLLTTPSCGRRRVGWSISGRSGGQTTATAWRFR